MLSLRAAGMTTTMTWEDDLQLTLLAYFLVSEGLLHLSPWVQVGQRHHSLDRFRKLMLREVRSLTQGFMMDTGQETRFSDTSSSGNSENRDSTRSVSPFNLLKRISIAQLPNSCVCHMTQFRGVRLPGSFQRSTDILGDARGKWLATGCCTNQANLTILFIPC